MPRENLNFKQCYSCHGWEVIKNGKTSDGGQRYRCKECGHTFVCHEGFSDPPSSPSSSAPRRSSNPRPQRTSSQILNNSGSKNTTNSIILCCVGFLGIGGLHRLYNKKYLSGLLYLITFGLFGVGTLLDLIAYFAKTDIIPGNPLIK